VKTKGASAIMYKKILVAVDDTELGKTAFQTALDLASRYQAQMMLIHVLSPISDAYPDSIFITPLASGAYIGLHEELMRVYAEQWKTFEQKGIEMLQRLTQIATDQGVPTEFTQALGDTGRAICDLAQNWQSDLIVMGRRGLKGLSELFLGSVSNYVLHNAHCSLLIVQGQTAPEDQQTEDKAGEKSAEIPTAS
jgi:nucleotide-binding universal stress UspA family protein